MYKDIEEQLNKVIVILESEIAACKKGKGVYKKILENYKKSLDAIQNDKRNEITIVGGVRFLADNLQEGNPILLVEMSKSEKLINKMNE